MLFVISASSSTSGVNETHFKLVFIMKILRACTLLRPTNAYLLYGHHGMVAFRRKYDVGSCRTFGEWRLLTSIIHRR
ncbi:hypothetical protein BC938DRAFT_479679 [Jimgerdemannia flammicorona]|uniref:Uncharacterized protein n=1 Tax=Jimgerdemannia flammicorona TaxID=994334 RepID=A0A433QKF0_9FUNG|nr:hypothetical protein BC938DRAFT_479679 [Jimgerdemannia flammicorona]